MGKARVEELDVMRASAIIMVVILHVAAAFMVYSLTNSKVFYLGLFLNQWSRICLPIFVFVSGFGLFYSHSTDFNIKRFYTRRLSKVFIPYVVWSFIYMIFRDLFNPDFHFIDLPFGQAMLSYLQWTFWQNIHITLWFILMILQLYFLFPVFRWVLSKIRNMKYFIILNTIFYLGLIIYLLYFRQDTGFVTVDFLLGHYKVNALGWYYYFILGGTAAACWNSIKSKKYNVPALVMAYTVTTVIVILEAYLGFLNHGQMHLENYVSLRPTVMFNTLSVLPLGFIIARKVLKFKWLSYAAKYISRYAYGIFFVHPQVLTAMKAVLSTLVGTYTTRMCYLIVLLISTLAISVMFCYIVDKTPLATILLGTSQQRSDDKVKGE